MEARLLRSWSWEPASVSCAVCSISNAAYTVMSGCPGPPITVVFTGTGGSVEDTDLLPSKIPCLHRQHQKVCWYSDFPGAGAPGSVIRVIQGFFPQECPWKKPGALWNGQSRFFTGWGEGRERDVEGLNVFMSFARQDTVSRLQAR